MRSLEILPNFAFAVGLYRNKIIYFFRKKNSRIFWRLEDNIYLCTALEKRKHGGCSSVG